MLLKSSTRASRLPRGFSRGSAIVSSICDKQLRDSEEAAAKFRAENGFLQSNGNVTLSQQQLQELNAKLSRQEPTWQRKKRAWISCARLHKRAAISEHAGLADSPTLKALRQQEAAISQKEADLAARYNDAIRSSLMPAPSTVTRTRDQCRNAASWPPISETNTNWPKRGQEAVEREFRQATGQTGDR